MEDQQFAETSTAYWTTEAYSFMGWEATKFSASLANDWLLLDYLAHII